MNAKECETLILQYFPLFRQRLARRGIRDRDLQNDVLHEFVLRAAEIAACYDGRTQPVTYVTFRFLCYIRRPPKRLRAWPTVDPSKIEIADMRLPSLEDRVLVSEILRLARYPDLLRMRYMEDVPLKALSRIYGVSRQRICQIIQADILRIRSILNERNHDDRREDQSRSQNPGRNAAGQE